jgi:outer membrane receptor protein involved in Fe transport
MDRLKAWALLWQAGLLILAPAAGLAQPSSAAPTPVEPLVVVASTPLPGSGVDIAKAPEQIHVLTASDLARAGPADALGALNEQVGAINLDSAAGNPFQPTLVYHGFEASPLQGTSQGLAVYVDGVRFNQPFGDTVNWDLIPDIAIARVTLEGSNPVFGLNALGGSLNVRLKTGVDFHGGDADVSGGSFGKVEGAAEYGGSAGPTAFYVAVRDVHEAGWRDLQASDIQSAYADLAWQGEPGQAHLGVQAANAILNGPGTSPVQLLAADPRAQFTAPNAIANRYAALTASGDLKLTARTSVQVVAYVDNFHQQVTNGNAPNDTPCNDGSGLLCDGAGDPSATLGGATIPAFLGSSPFAYSELDKQTTLTNAYGVSGQATNAGVLLGLGNHGVAGVSFDGAATGFSAISYIGGLTPVTRVFVGPGVVIDEPGQNTPVRVSVIDANEAAFVTDTLDVGSRLSVTAAGRYNLVQVNLRDRLGGDLSGDHRYGRFNPAVGASFRAAPWLTGYAGYSQANRAPTPAELSCAGPNQSCSLANFFVGDPNLKQVVAHTVEAGLRGRWDGGWGGAFSYSLGLYRTDLGDDIVFINSVTLGRAFFTNIGATRRQGLDADLTYKAARWSAYVAYSHTDAAFRSGFVESAGGNPAADANGDITIRPGDRLPGAPADQVKLGLRLEPTRRLSLGAAAVARGASYLVGDEANLTPPLPGFFVVNLDASYRLTPRLQLFVRVENATDARYFTFGGFSPTSAVFLAQAPGASDPRSYSPSAPIGVLSGVRLTF